MNYIEEYYKKIKSGEIVASRKVRIVYKKLVEDIKNPRIVRTENEITGEIEEHKYIYNNEKALHAIEFIEKFCRHSKGKKWAGQPFLLELWQKALVSAMFGFVDKETGFRKYRKVILFVARKNGKSTLAAAIGLYMLMADDEPGAECYSIATKKDQAKILWQEAKRMVKKNPLFLKRVKPLVAELYYESEESTFKPLSNESDTLDGLNASFVAADEVHAMKDKNLIDVTYDSMETRDQPIFFETSTMGTTRENVFDGEYDYASNVINTYEDPSLGFVDETLLPIIYELDSKKEWTNEKCWEKANPGLGTIKKIKGIRDKVARAKIKPDELKNLLCKDFNVRETSVSSWLSYEDLNNDATYNLAKMKVRYGIGGTDLSSTTDLTAAKVIFMLPNDPIIYAMQQYWLPEELLEQKIKEDKIPYDKWLERGLLRLCPGNKIHPKEVTKWFLEVRDDYGIYLPWIGYDAWSAEYWVEEMKGNFGEEAMIEVHQGKKTLSAPMKNLGADLKSKLINYNNNPIDKWCLSNTNVDTDRNGNIQPDKGRNARLRIDGMSALLDAYVVLEQKKNDYLNMI